MTETTTAATKARDGSSTRDAIVVAATRLMQVKGYTATSLDDVLRESGVGKGSFYHFFRSKEELGHAILDTIVQGFIARTVDPCFSEAAVKPITQIRCFLDRVVATQRAGNCVGGCPLGNLASELSDVHEGFREKLAEVFSTWRARLTRALEQAQRRGEARPECRPESVAHFVVASLEGAILMAKVTKDIRVMEQCVEELKRYLAIYETEMR
jgi:TetR/AcrR family transcriptional regulator, transcriptional repressor for nem operon